MALFLLTATIVWIKPIIDIGKRINMPSPQKKSNKIPTVVAAAYNTNQKYFLSSSRPAPGKIQLSIIAPNILAFFIKNLPVGKSGIKKISFIILHRSYLLLRIFSEGNGIGYPVKRLPGTAGAADNNGAVIEQASQYSLVYLDSFHFCQ